jgi:hypothetical protein
MAIDPDVSTIRELGNLPKDTVLSDSRITCWYPLAKRTLTSWVGADNMASSDVDVIAALKMATHFLVLSYGVQSSFNMSVTAQGIVVNKNMGGEAGTITLAGKDLLQYYADSYMARAREIATPYLTPAAGANTLPLGISRANYCEDEA